ncbi:MAG: pseudaminic acid synthase [Candidatus Zambryskibacteria bacterium]
MKNKTIKIGNKIIAENMPAFIVAEMSGNHNQDINRAFAIIDAAASAGADAVKLQTYTPETITIDANNKHFVIKSPNKDWNGKTLFGLYGEAYTPWDWQPKLKKYVESKGLICFSTPFDDTAVDFLEKMKVGVYKVASPEVVDIPLLERIGKTRKPVIMSRGMATISEIKLALKTLRENGCSQVIILQCVSAYPAKAEDMNLLTISDIEKRFKTIAGLSDHSLTTDIAVAAVALGAKVIEKHLTLKRSDGGPDAAFSLEPDEFKKMVEAIRVVEKAVGKPFYGSKKGVGENIMGRKSLFVVKDVKAGEKFTRENLKSIRPGYGLEPKYYRKVLGKLAAKNISRGTPLKLNMII